MKPTAVAVFLFFLLVYGLLNYYVGLRGFRYLSGFFPGLSGVVYWTVFWLLAGSYFGGMLLKGVLPNALGVPLTWVGSYWLAALTYLVLLLAAADPVRLVFPSAERGLAVGIALLLVVILACGTWNAWHPRVSRYQVNLPAAGPLDSLRVVLVSDVHLGSIVQLDRLERLVDQVNRLEPDLVLLAGDVADRDFDVLPREQLVEGWRRLKPRLGSYAVLGNHDYYSGKVGELVADLERGGIRVLRDQTVKVADSFYLVGRDDPQRRSFAETGRRSLAELLAGVEAGLPVVLLDHQPSRLEEAESLGVDLLLSGHTHRGQLFPFNLLTRRLFEVDWGYLRKGSLQVIVSCGYGTWGPPVRIGSRPEVVELRIGFGGCY